MRCYIKAPLLAAAFLVCGLAGCNKEPKVKYTAEQLKDIPMPLSSSLPNPSGGLVLAVNSETLSSDEIVSQFLAQVSPVDRQMDYNTYAAAAQPIMRQILTDNVSNLLLYQRAKITVPESVFEEGGQLDTAVDTEIRRFLASYENNYAVAQQEIERQGFDWKTFRQYQRKQILAQTYFVDKIERNPAISRKQIVDYYNANRETHFKQEQKTSFLLIEIPKGDDAGAALQKAQKALQEAKSGKDFLQCINQYSEGVKDKTGGLWETKDPQSFAAPYNAIAAKLDAMSVNDVSEIIDGGSRFFIVKLLENKKGGYIAVEDVQQDIEKHLKGIKRKEQMEKMLRELFEQADITGLEGFMQYCIRQAYLRTRG